MTELEKPTSREMAVEAMGLSFAVILAAPAGPLAPLLAAAITPLTSRMIQKAADEWRRKSNMIADAALEVSGFGDAEEFCEALTDDPELIALAQKILIAASQTADDRRLRTFGALLGDAVRQRGDRLDETQLLATALGEIEAPHVVVLAVLAEPPPGASERGRHLGWNLQQVEAAVPMEANLVLACLNGLTRHGLADSPTGYGGATVYVITDFGRALLKVIGRLSSQPGDAEHPSGQLQSLLCSSEHPEADGVEKPDLARGPEAGADARRLAGSGLHAGADTEDLPDHRADERTRWAASVRGRGQRRSRRPGRPPPRWR